MNALDAHQRGWNDACGVKQKEIDRLKKIIEQADLNEVFEVSSNSVFLRANDGFVGNNEQVPELYEYLNGWFK